MHVVARARSATSRKSRSPTGSSCGHGLKFAHELVEHGNGLRLGQNVGYMELASDEGEHKHEAHNVVAQALLRSENVLRLLEGHRIKRKVDAALGVGEDARRSIRREKQVMEQFT